MPRKLTKAGEEPSRAGEAPDELRGEWGLDDAPDGWEPEARREIRIAGLIAPVFHPVHADLKRGGHAEYWLKGGRGSGKSSFAALEVIVGLLRCPEAHAIVYRRVAATLRDSVVSQMLWAAEALGLLPNFRLKLSPPELVFLPTGQRVLFRGGDDPGKSKSIKPAKGYFKYLWFEEVSDFEGMDDIRSIQASALRGGGAVTLCTYNPPRSPRHWVNAEVMAPRAGRIVHHSDYTGMPRRWLGEGFFALAEALRAANERAFRHAYLGEVTGEGGQVFDNLRVRPIARGELDGLDRLYFGLDHGFAVDPAALVAVRYDPARRRLFVTDEFVKVGASYDALAEAARRLLPPGGSITADSAEPRSNDELARRGVRVAGAVKGAGSLEHGMRWLQDLSAIVVDPARTPFAAREFSGYEYPPDRLGGYQARYPDRDNHTIDAVRYALEPVIGRRAVRVPERRHLGI